MWLPFMLFLLHKKGLDPMQSKPLVTELVYERINYSGHLAKRK